MVICLHDHFLIEYLYWLFNSEGLHAQNRGMIDMSVTYRIYCLQPNLLENIDSIVYD